MAVTVDYNDLVNTSPTHGVYGIYNRFIARITTSETAKFKTSYRIRLTVFDESLYQLTSFVSEVEVNNQTDKIGIINPVKQLRERWFKGNFNSDILETNNKYAYTKVKIEVGESYADTADIPPTFRGYDEEDVFYFYNGYEPYNQDYRELNYRETNWYDTTPIKLPLVQKTNYVGQNDTFVMSCPSEIIGNFFGFDTYRIADIVWKSYTVDGIPVDTTTIDLSSSPSLSGKLGYWSYNVVPTMYLTPATYFQNPVIDYIEVYFTLEPLEGGTGIETEKITFRRAVCNPKFNRYRLRWLNRYGAEDYLNFINRTNKTLRITQGKNIISDNINYDSTSYEDITNVENPDIITFGKSSRIEWKLSSDYLTQEQIDSLVDLYKSTKVLMYDENDEAIPVIVRDTSFKIENIKNNLYQISVTLFEANREPNQIQ